MQSVKKMKTSEIYHFQREEFKNKKCQFKTFKISKGVRLIKKEF